MKKISYQHLWYISGLGLADLLLFTTTNATKIPSFVVIVGFVLLVLTIYVIVRGLLNLLALYGLHLPHQRQLATYLSILVGGILALQSIGELDKRDVLVWLPLIITGYLYSAYAKTSRRNLES